MEHLFNAILVVLPFMPVLMAYCDNFGEGGEE